MGVIIPPQVLLGLPNTWTKQNTFAAGVITTSQPLPVTQTWNAGGITFVGKQTTITNTASAAGSLIERWTFGVVNVAAINTIGALVWGTAGPAVMGSIGLDATGASMKIRQNNADMLNIGWVNNDPSQGAVNIQGVGTNRLQIQSDASIVHISTNGDYEWESPGATTIAFTGYVSSSAVGKAFTFTNSGQTPGSRADVLYCQTYDSTKNSLSIYYQTTLEAYVDYTGTWFMGGAQFLSSASAAWSSGALGASSDLFLTRPAAATLQQGAADAAAPVAQTLKAQSGTTGSGSDIGGPDFTIKPGLGTGFGTTSTYGLGRIVFSTPVQKATGTTVQTYAAACYIGPQTITSATSNPVINANQTWNNAGLTATAFLLNVTNTSSNAASALMDLQVAGVSRFSITATGNIVATLTGANPGFLLSGATSSTRTAQIYQNVDNFNIAAQNVGVIAQVALGAPNSSFVLDSTGLCTFGNTVIRINQTPTVVSGASVLISSAADGAANIGHRISINMNGTTYWIPASTTAF